MATALLTHAAITAVLAVLLLLVALAQAAAPARLRREVGARAGAALGGVDAAVRQPLVVCSR